MNRNLVCYECEKDVLLVLDSRCIHCWHGRNKVNMEYADKLSTELANYKEKVISLVTKLEAGQLTAVEAIMHEMTMLVAKDKYKL